MKQLLLFVWILLAFSDPTLANEQSSPIKGAACLVSDASGRVLVTRDILNNRIAIPGGYVDSDNPADAAVRETLEETGIKVKAVGELARLRNSVLYNCVALSPIPVHTAESGNGTVAAWHAEHFGREVRNVFLVKPESINLEDARFPDQVKMFPELLKKANSSEIDERTDFSHLAHDFSVWNADINRTIQSAIHSLPAPLSDFIGTLITWASSMGSGALFFLLIPIAIATGGVKRASKTLLVTILATVIVSFGKLYFGVPRPFYIFPDLQLANASGFAFPSGHTATAFAVWGLIYHWVKQAGHDRLSIWLVPALLVALSRVYLGVHYVTDVIAGAVIGVLTVFIVNALSRRNFKEKPLLLHPLTWSFVGLLVVPFAATQIQPLFLYCMVFSFVFALMLERNTRALNADKPMGTKCGFMTLAVVVMVAANAFGIAQLSHSSIEILAINCAAIALLAVWIARGAALVSK
ncbi:phosphatase PAP2 family protein [Enterovibrio sp. ZSDZ35]|uniref:undecaprenyl-diphosphate phosphatase n=1 Tax=Enterovibrio qingdaonensis TaxID=2899818 RepID=A0ABT5QLQ3_9GAMM|nr:phosphatase PAP2 family protein [Enterovibrio sp. ZSDZ35]MDD1781915.1 phosphatase PAP2 family protein [Enterovibrio sp. ZSDZ35]